KSDLLQRAAVACFPALDGESFGVVLLEAMAAGAAIVASDIDGYRTVARAGREALLVPPGDAEALRSAIAGPLGDGGRRSPRAAAGRARAEEFSVERLAARFLDVYELARTRPVPAPA